VRPFAETGKFNKGVSILYGMLRRMDQGVARILEELSLGGVNVLPVLRGEPGEVQTRRFWQWNRYTPLVTSTAD